jgi:hypothetical protein
VELFLGVVTTTHNRSINDRGQIHDKYASYQKNHMDGKADERIRVHEREEGNGDLM